MNSQFETSPTNNQLETDSKFTYLEVFIKPNLVSNFIQNQLFNLVDLEESCYLDLREDPYAIVMPRTTYEKVKPLVDTIYFTKAPVAVNLEKYLESKTSKFKVAPKVNDICRLHFEVGEFIITEVNSKEQTVTVKNTSKSEVMTVPYKYINLNE